MSCMVQKCMRAQYVIYGSQRYARSICYLWFTTVCEGNLLSMVHKGYVIYGSY